MTDGCPTNSTKGLGSLPSSNRREFRRFRRVKKAVAAGKEEDASATIPTIKQDKKEKLCRYFNTAKGCRMGSDCVYKHVIKPSPSSTIKAPLEVVEDQSETPVTVVPTVVNIKQTVVRRLCVNKGAVGDPTQIDIRSQEKQYFKRRFRGTILNALSDSSCNITFKYPITEPQWVFDVKDIKFILNIKGGHPIDRPTISVPEEGNPLMPDSLRSHVSSQINSSIETKYENFEKFDFYEAIGKFLIRWIDHNIMEMFVTGLTRLKLHVDAQAAGISLVVPNPKQEIDKQTECSVEEKETSSQEIEEDDENSENDSETSCSSEENKQENTKSTVTSVRSYPIEVHMAWNNMSKNIASLSSKNLEIVSNCCRCRESSVHLVTTNEKICSWRCLKCSNTQSLSIRSCLVHENNNTIANIDARGCRPVDCILLNSTFMFVCLSCGKEDSVQTINYGEAHKSWCRQCHALCEFMISVIRFRGIFTEIPLEDKEAAKAIPKIKKKPTVLRDAVVSGQPLPFNGTCKHYKKSYRWLRFPCCGRTFPCDICHEEASLGHEMKQANRMVCGHCSTEQPFQKDKPCISCHENVTRRKSHYWEGGKGCRDQTKLNRNDAHKFTGSRKKTVSKQKVPELVVKK